MNLVLVVVGVLVLCVNITLFVVLTVLEMKTRRGTKQELDNLIIGAPFASTDLCVMTRLLVGGVLMVISAVLWIAVGVHVGTQDSESWGLATAN